MNICIKNLFLLYFLPRKWIFFRTNIFVRLFQVRWHFHSVAWDLFPTSPQGHDNLNIVLKHSWFSLLPHVLNVSLVSPFLPSFLVQILALLWPELIQHFNFWKKTFCIHFDFTSWIPNYWEQPEFYCGFKNMYYSSETQWYSLWSSSI